MATELAKAYVQIVPSAQGIQGSITKALDPEADSAGKSAGKKAGESAGSNLVSTLKKVVVAAGIGKVIKDSLDAGGALQQSFGGLDTLYGEASDAAKNYAMEAAKAGISANDYAEQAVSFGASLKQAFAGDAAKAVEAANTAIMDMADNSAKMGTPIENIQNAYQGFAKQNYTMLDNLKLGYGGTKTEMERLLKDATKLSGVKYDLSNLGDVYEAIHVIQQDLGLTGVAADEAATTFTGSFGAMKASAQNLLADLSLGRDLTADVQTLAGNAVAFVGNNLLPMLTNIASQIPTLIGAVIANVGPMLQTAGPQIIENIRIGITEGIPALLVSAREITGQIYTGITEGLPQIFDMAADLIMEFCAQMEVQLPAILDTGTGIVIELVNGIVQTLPELLNTAGEAVIYFCEKVDALLPKVLTSGVTMIKSLVTGVLQSLPQVITTAAQVVTKMLDTYWSMGPQIQQKGIELIKFLVNGLKENFPAIVQAAGEAIAKLITTLIEHLPEILKTGIELVAALVSGLLEAVGLIISAIPTLVKAIVDGFKDHDWGKLGSEIIDGIVTGIKNGAIAVARAVKNVAKAAFDAVVDFFDIGSPSKLMRDKVGVWIPAGIAAGISANAGVVTDAIDEITGGVLPDAAAALSADLSTSAFVDGQASDMGRILALLERYLPEIGSDIVIDDRVAARVISKGMGALL